MHCKKRAELFKLLHVNFFISSKNLYPTPTFIPYPFIRSTAFVNLLQSLRGRIPRSGNDLENGSPATLQECRLASFDGIFRTVRTTPVTLQQLRAPGMRVCHRTAGISNISSEAKRVFCAVAQSGARVPVTFSDCRWGSFLFAEDCGLV